MNRTFLFSGLLAVIRCKISFWMILSGLAVCPVQARAQLDSAVAGRLARLHFEICNEADSAARSALFKTAYAQDIRSVDPLSEAAGFTGMQAAISQLHQLFPGAVLSISGQVLAHHDVVKVDYILGEPGKPPIATGVDILVLKQGLIHRIYTFPDR